MAIVATKSLRCAPEVNTHTGLKASDKHKDRGALTRASCFLSHRGVRMRTVAPPNARGRASECRELPTNLPCAPTLKPHMYTTPPSPETPARTLQLRVSTRPTHATHPSVGPPSPPLPHMHTQNKRLRPRCKPGRASLRPNHLMPTNRHKTTHRHSHSCGRLRQKMKGMACVGVVRCCAECNR